LWRNIALKRVAFGGDVLANLQFVDGDSQKIKAESLLYVGSLVRFGD
jgi:hypothetical protein